MWATLLIKVHKVFIFLFNYLLFTNSRRSFFHSNFVGEKYWVICIFAKQLLFRFVKVYFMLSWIIYFLCNFFAKQHIFKAFKVFVLPFWYIWYGYLFKSFIYKNMLGLLGVLGGHNINNSYNMRPSGPNTAQPYHHDPECNRQYFRMMNVYIYFIYLFIYF